MRGTDAITDGSGFGDAGVVVLVPVGAQLVLEPEDIGGDIGQRCSGSTEF